MPINQIPKEILVTTEVTRKEANLIKRIRSIAGSGEFLIVVENHRVKRLQYAKVFTPIKQTLTGEELVIFFNDKVQFGEVNVLIRNGKPYGIKNTVEYDDLSSGL